MNQLLYVCIIIGLVTGSLFIAGCTSLINQHDIAFLSSLEEFQNESINRISHIHDNIRMQEWDAARENLAGYREVLQDEISHLQSLEVTDRIVPVRDKAIIALKRQDQILQSVLEYPELNASSVSRLTSDFLADSISSAMRSHL